jgi:serine/threonine-protein kinase RsbW
MNYSTPWNLDETIASLPDLANQLTRRILDQLESIGWNEQDVFGVHLALEEALMNAIKHGNQRDPNKKIRIVVELTDAKFQATVTDEGCGFDLEKVPDPTLDENLNKASGRGISLMRLFMDELQFNACGNAVQMSKIRQVN